MMWFEDLASFMALHTGFTYTEMYRDIPLERLGRIAEQVGKKLKEMYKTK